MGIVRLLRPTSRVRHWSCAACQGAPDDNITCIIQFCVFDFCCVWPGSDLDSIGAIGNNGDVRKACARAASRFHCDLAPRMWAAMCGRPAARGMCDHSQAVERVLAGLVSETRKDIMFDRICGCRRRNIAGSFCVASQHSKARPSTTPMLTFLSKQPASPPALPCRTSGGQPP